LKFQETIIAGAFLLEPQPIGDDRGFFARTYCEKEFKEHGLTVPVRQCNLSFNVHKGTLRGMHYQTAPAMESKLIRCTQGAILDVIVDLRPDSKTYMEHISVELTQENRTALYVPENFAHGFQTLMDNTEVSYQVTEFYSPEYERGLRYDDPKLAIVWPEPVSAVSAKDSAWDYLP